MSLSDPDSAINPGVTDGGDVYRPETVSLLQDPLEEELPKHLFYSTSVGIGGPGLNTTALETVRASVERGFLRKALCFGVDRRVHDLSVVHSLNWHPVRALSCLDSQEYYAAKKRYVAWWAGRKLRRRVYDCFHSWSGDCFESLVEARRQGVPTLIDIPTWHRNKGRMKGPETQTERERRTGRVTWRSWLEVGRLRMLAEYDLADVILIPSAQAAETFLAAGVPAAKLHYVGRGVDAGRYRPGRAGDRFKVCFVGALIERKGVHHLLEAWKKLALKDAELVLIGSLHEEMKPHLQKWGASGVRMTGFSSRVEEELSDASLFVFPSLCEGFAKATIEAAACALPVIATRESGDAVVDGETGWLIAADDPRALADAIDHAYQNRDALAGMGARGRQRVESCLTWDHFRRRLLNGYAKAMKGMKS